MNIIIKKNNEEGLILALSSPSGCGKTVIVNSLLKQEKLSSNKIVKSVSVTTRKPRLGEVNGKDYFFVNEKEFHKLCQDGKMLEYKKIFKNFYGIPRNFIEQNLKMGTSILLSINWQGVFSLLNIMKKNIVSIFILPPSIEELRLRLQKRNTDSLDEIERRLSEARIEISKSNKYDYKIINNDIYKSVEKIKCILKKEKFKRKII